MDNWPKLNAISIGKGCQVLENISSLLHYLKIETETKAIKTKPTKIYKLLYLQIAGLI